MKRTDTYRLISTYVDLLESLTSIRPHSSTAKLYNLHTATGIRPADQYAEFEKHLQTCGINRERFLENCIKRNIVGYSTLGIRFIAMARRDGTQAAMRRLPATTVSAIAQLASITTSVGGPFKLQKIQDSMDAVLGRVTADHQTLVIAGLAGSGLHVNNPPCDDVIAMFSKSVSSLFDALGDVPFKSGHLKVLRIIRLLFGIFCYEEEGVREVDNKTYVESSRRLSELKISATTLAAAPMPTADIVRWLKEDDASTVSRTGAEYIHAVSRFVVR